MSDSKLKSLRKGLRDADRILFEITGTHLRTIAKKGIDLATEALSRSVFEDVDSLDSAYQVLGVRPDAPDTVVKYAFRGLSRDLHPDTGLNPDPGKFTQVIDAYRAIMLARYQDNGSEGPPEENGNE